MKILLVGGTGVLSSEVLARSIEKEYDVYVLNRGKRKNIYSEFITTIKGDMRKPKEISMAIKDHYFDVVVDFVCYTEDDIKRSLSIFKLKCKQYIFISSAAVYDVENGETFLRENSPLGSQTWQYSVDKVKCENIVTDFCKENNVNYTIIRPGVTYGNTRIPYGIMPPHGLHWTVVSRIINNKPIILWDGGKNFSTITHVKDFAVGAVGIFGNKNAYGEAYNIVSDERFQWVEVLDTLEKVLGKKILRCNVDKNFLSKMIPRKKGEILIGRSIDFVIDNSKIKKLVPEFTQSISLYDGINDVIHHYRKNNYVNGIDFKFDGQMDRVVNKYQNITKNYRFNKKQLSYIDYLDENSQCNQVKYLVYKHGLNHIIYDSFISKYLVKIKRLILSIG